MSNGNQCWKCPEIFDTQRQLKTHGASKHSFLKVLCPWCYEDNCHSYKKVGELKEHAKKRHPIEIQGLPQLFFSENAAFYLAINPEDYKRLVRPSKWDSLEAEAVRNQVTQWTHVAKRPFRTLTEFQEGWESEVMARDDISIYSNITSIDGKDQVTEEEYVPENPSLKEPELKKINLTPGNVFSEYTCHLDLYKAEISDSIFTDPKCLASLASKMSSLPADTSLDPSRTQSYKLSGNNLKEQTCIVQKMLLLDSKHITQIKRIEQDFFIQSEPPAKINKPERHPLEDLKSNDQKDENLDKPPTTKTPTDPHEDQENQPPKTQRNRNPPPCISSVDSHIDVPPTKQQDRSIITLNQRSRKILQFGNMPLLPPARRNLEREEILKLEGTSLSWPPKGWRKMTGDQKKLAWEFAATTLESMRNSLQYLNRTDLLDKYNFLALPGTSEDGNHSDNKVKSKARYYNYEYLRTISTKSNHTRDDRDFVEMMEKSTCARNKSVDFLIHQLNRYNIPLRLME